MKQITKDLIRTAVTVHPNACPLVKELRLRLGHGVIVGVRSAETIKGGLHAQDAHDPAIFHLIDEDDLVGVTIILDYAKAKGEGVTNVPTLISWVEKKAKAA